MRQQHLYRVRFPGERGRHERRLAGFGSAVGVGAGLQQTLDHGRVPLVHASERG